MMKEAVENKKKDAVISREQQFYEQQLLDEIKSLESKISELSGKLQQSIGAFSYAKHAHEMYLKNFEKIEQ